MTPRWQARLCVGAAAAVVAVLVLPPLLTVLGEALAAGASLARLGAGPLWLLCVRSTVLSALVTLCALALGVPLGVVFATARFPLRKLLFALHVAIVPLPPLLPALGWFHLLGREGLIGSAATSAFLFGAPGLVLVLVSCFTPIVTALTALGVRGVEASLLEAARIAGGPLRAATRVLVPCAAPAVALAAIVVFTLAFSELGVATFLRVQVYPAAVFARLGGMDFAPGEAAALALPALLLTLALFALERRFAGRRAIALLGGGRASTAPLFTGGACRLWAGLAAVASALPRAARVLHASDGSLSELLMWAGDAPLNGLRAAALTALVLTAVALVLGGELARGGRVASVVDGLAAVAFVLPPSLLGVGIAMAWNRPATVTLYASFAVLVVGLCARYAVVAMRGFAAAVAQLPPSLDEAARSVGAGYLRRLWLVAGLARRGLAATFVLALVFALRDFETSVLFYPPGGEPLPVRIFTLEANGPSEMVAALATLHIALTLGAALLAFALLAPRRTA